MHSLKIIALILPMTLCGQACGISAVPETTPSDAVAMTPDLEWLQGHWRREAGTQVNEEMWTDAEGGMMFAISRTVREGEVVGFEYMRIHWGDPVVLVAQPGGAAATSFSLVEQGDQRVVFANPDNDYPTHIEYARDGDALTAQIWGADGRGNGPSWRWEQVPD